MKKNTKSSPIINYGLGMDDKLDIIQGENIPSIQEKPNEIKQSQEKKNMNDIKAGKINFNK